MSIKFSSLVSAIIALPLSLYAARPFVTDDAGIVEQGLFELEVATDYWKKRASFGIVLKHGLTKRMDIGAAFAYNVLPKDEMAAYPLELMLKYNFIPDHFSTSLTTSFNSAVFSLNTMYTHSFKYISLNANLGTELTGSIKEIVLTYGFTTLINLDRITLGAEIGGTHEQLTSWQAGTQIFVTDWLALDIGFGGNFQKKIHLNATTGMWITIPVTNPDE